MKSASAKKRPTASGAGGEELSVRIEPFGPKPEQLQALRIGRFGLVARVRRRCILGHEHLPETNRTRLMRDRHRLLRRQQIGAVKGSR
jgi:hypothetical protein